MTPRHLPGRAAHLGLGGALALPYAGLGWLFAAAAGKGPVLPLVLLGGLAVLGGIGVALLPVVRPLGIVTARALLGVDLPVPDDASGRSGGRLRAAAWFALTVLTGAVAVLAVLVLLPQAVGFAVLPVTGGELVLGAGLAWRVPGPVTLLGPLAGLVCLALAVLVVSGLGAWLARLAPWFLGPTPDEALALERARAGRLAWRARLAGELHDHLGHTLTAVTLQAGAARRVLQTGDGDADAAVRALAAIEERGRGAVDELDRVLGLLRDPDGADPGPLAAPDDVPTLVEGIRATGRAVTLRLAGDPGPLARRVVQEGLTNAVRHAAPGPVGVDVDAGPGGTRVEVASPMAPAAHRPPTRTGHGLVGLRERVEAAGGTLAAGPAGEAWVLRAELIEEPGR